MMKKVTHLTVHAPIPGYRCMHCYAGGTIMRGKWVDIIFFLYLGVDEWFKWSNRVQKGNECLKHTHFSSKKVCFLPIVCVRNFYNNNRIFLKKVSRVTVHAPIPGYRCMHCYAGGTVKRGNRVIENVKLFRIKQYS